MNNIPKNIFVFSVAKRFNALESFFAKICVMVKTTATKTIKLIIEKIPIVDVIIKNQKVNPKVTADALNLGDESSILNWIYQCNQTTLCHCSNSYHSKKKYYNWKHVEFSFNNKKLKNFFHCT